MKHGELDHSKSEPVHRWWPFWSDFKWFGCSNLEWDLSAEPLNIQTTFEHMNVTGSALSRGFGCLALSYFPCSYLKFYLVIYNKIKQIKAKRKRLD